MLICIKDYEGLPFEVHGNEKITLEGIMEFPSENELHVSLTCWDIHKKESLKRFLNSLIGLSFDSVKVEDTVYEGVKLLDIEFSEDFDFENCHPCVEIGDVYIENNILRIEFEEIQGSIRLKFKELIIPQIDF